MFFCWPNSFFFSLQNCAVHTWWWKRKYGKESLFKVLDIVIDTHDNHAEEVISKWILIGSCNCKGASREQFVFPLVLKNGKNLCSAALGRQAPSSWVSKMVRFSGQRAKWDWKSKGRRHSKFFLLCSLFFPVSKSSLCQESFQIEIQSHRWLDFDVKESSRESKNVNCQIRAEELKREAATYFAYLTVILSSSFPIYAPLIINLSFRVHHQRNEEESRKISLFFPRHWNIIGFFAG